MIEWIELRKLWYHKGQQAKLATAQYSTTTTTSTVTIFTSARGDGLKVALKCNQLSNKLCNLQCQPAPLHAGGVTQPRKTFMSGEMAHGHESYDVAGDPNFNNAMHETTGGWVGVGVGSPRASCSGTS
jgi:hypothetical protein